LWSAPEMRSAESAEQERLFLGERKIHRLESFDIQDAVEDGRRKEENRKAHGGGGVREDGLRAQF